MLAFTHADALGDDEDAEMSAYEKEVRDSAAIFGEIDRHDLDRGAVTPQEYQARGDARERAMQESLAAQERSVTAALAAQGRDAEELFRPAGWQPDDEKKVIDQQAVVPARCRGAAAQPVGYGAPPFGASQRLMWTVCMLGMFVCVAGALRGTGELGSAGGGPAHVAEEFFTDEHGRVWYYPEPVEVTFEMQDIDGWEHRLQEAVDVLTARVRDVLPSDGGAAADGGALAAGGAHVYGRPPFDVAEDCEETAVLGDYEDEYEY
eukprot:gene33953-43894_t